MVRDGVRGKEGGKSGERWGERKRKHTMKIYIL